MIYSILFSTLVPSTSVTPLGWAGESQHGEADILRPVSSREARPYRSLPVWEIVKGCGPTQIRVSITGQSSFNIVFFFRKTVELPPLSQIRTNFFCAAHWVNWLGFHTSKINMLISFVEEFVDMEANLSFLSKTKNQHDMCGMINGDLSVHSVLTWCATEVVFFYESWLRLWLISPMHTACTDYIYTWQSPAKICPVCESPEFVWESFITFWFLLLRVGRHSDSMHLFCYVYIISQHIVSSRNFCVSFPFTSAMCA